VDRPPTAAQVLQFWEQSRSQTPVQRAISLLSLAAPAEAASEFYRYSIGRRDQALLGLRESLFGPAMSGAAKCPACGQSVETEFSVADIRAERASDPDQQHVMQWEGYEVHFRLPNCHDLTLVNPDADLSHQKSTLLRCCILSVHYLGQPVTADSLPEPLTEAISQGMAKLDLPGDIQLALNCPHCGHSWIAPLDIASYLWNEIHAWAMRMLRDVHELASAYGWPEADILALSPRRRQAYLELIRQ